MKPKVKSPKLLYEHSTHDRIKKMRTQLFLLIFAGKNIATLSRERNIPGAKSYIEFLNEEESYIIKIVDEIARSQYLYELPDRACRDRLAQLVVATTKAATLQKESTHDPRIG
jgi:hypothetical protein